MAWNGEVSTKYNRISKASTKRVYSELHVRNFCLGHTHRAPVWTGPCPARTVNSLKYSGTERPRKMETPIMKILRVMFMFANCSCEIPVPTAVNKCTNSEYRVTPYEEFRQKRIHHWCIVWLNLRKKMPKELWCL